MAKGSYNSESAMLCYFLLFTIWIFALLATLLFILINAFLSNIGIFESFLRIVNFAPFLFWFLFLSIIALILMFVLISRKHRHEYRYR
jgi:hypothetical protein